jgi:3',5'-cyclic-AMP phosphodiesterase
MPPQCDNLNAGDQQWLTRRPSDAWKLTRRSFLALLVAGCSQIARRPIQTEPREDVWALISDTHISSSPDQLVRGSNMAANLTRVVEDVVSVGPDHVLFNGDLARALGERADYAAFQGLISPLREQGMPIRMTIGNHDDRSRLVAAFSVTADGGVPDKVVSVASIGGTDWFFLDSLEQTNAIRGSLGSEQRAWLARELASNTAPAIICVHHDPEASLVGLKDAGELQGIILPCRRVKAVIFGHTHVFRVWQKDGLHFVNLPATGYRFFSPDVPLGWVRARVGGGGMRLEFRGVDPGERGHGMIHDLPWRGEA